MAYGLFSRKGQFFSQKYLESASTLSNYTYLPQGLGTKEEEEEEVSLRIEKVIKKKVRINRKSHFYFTRALYSPFLLLGVESAGKIKVGFTIDTDFFW